MQPNVWLNVFVIIWQELSYPNDFLQHPHVCAALAGHRCIKREQDRFGGGRAPPSPPFPLWLHPSAAIFCSVCAKRRAGVPLKETGSKMSNLKLLLGCRKLACVEFMTHGSHAAAVAECCAGRKYPSSVLLPELQPVAVGPYRRSPLNGSR